VSDTVIKKPRFLVTVTKGYRKVGHVVLIGEARITYIILGGMPHFECMGWSYLTEVRDHL
jgi:hypothetical protein